MTGPTRTSTIARRGVSLPEVVVSTMLVGVMIVASMNTIAATRRTQRATAERATAPGLAQELLAEILAHSYEDPFTTGQPLGPDAAEPTREFYDDVDDYHMASSVSLPLTDRSGASIPGYSGWTYHVDVEWVTFEMASSAIDTGIKRITVTVTEPVTAAEPSPPETTLVGVRARKGSLEQPSPVDLDAIVWVGAAIQTDASAPANRTGVHLPNFIPSPDAN